MEVYLCHMFVLRLMEKARLLHITSNETIKYCIASIGTIICMVLLSYISQRAIKQIEGKINAEA